MPRSSVRLTPFPRLFAPKALRQHRISSQRIAFSAVLLVLLLLVIPLSAADLVRTITVGTNPGQIVVNPSSHLAYVVNQGSNSVSVIDTQLLKVKATLTVGSAPIGIAVNPAAGLVFVANSGSGTITSISGTAVKSTWTVGRSEEHTSELQSHSF